MTYSPAALEAYVPRLDSSDEEIKKFVKRIINDDNKFRRWHMLRKANNLWMYQGRHWMRPISRARAGGSGIYHFEDLQRKAGRQFPEPVDNMIATGIDNEVARLGRKEYVPETTADSSQPELQQAARTAKNVLIYDLKQMVWADTREAIMFDLVATGTCVAHSYWDETQTEHSVVASPDAMFCPGCEKQFASAKIPEIMAQIGFPDEMGMPQAIQHPETLRPVESTERGRPPEVQMTHCPTCPEPVPLQPRTPLPEEAEGFDIFQRQLGIPIPKGQGLIEHDSPFEVYPENAGIGIEPRTCRIWGLKKVRDIGWVYARHTDCDVEPESPKELMRSHPMLGDGKFSESFSDEGDKDIYSQHVAVKQLFVDPMPIPGLEKGAVFTVIGEKVLEPKPLMVDVEVPGGKTKQVRRAKFGAHRRKRVPGQFWGRTPVDDAVPLQRRLNQIDAMDDDITEHGKPWMAVPMGSQFGWPQDPQGSLQIVEVDSPDGRWDDFKIVNANPLTGNAYHEKRAQIAQSIRDRLGPQEIEAGASGKAKTALEVKVLSEQVEEQRGPVERGLVTNVYDPLFNHHLEIAWAFKKDDTEYEIEETAGTYGVQSYKGTDLLGGIKVQVESKGDFSKSVYQIQATQDAATKGLYGDWMSDPVLRNQILENMDLPKVDGKQKLQILRAQQAWSEFIKDGSIPGFDPTIHAADIWFRVLNESWLGDEALDLQRKAEWPKFVDATAGWEKVLAKAEELDAQQRQFYEGFPPEQWPAIQAEASAKVQEIESAQQKTADEASRVPGAQVPPSMPVPQIPPPPDPMVGFLPEALHLRIGIILRQKGAALLSPVPMGVDPAALADKTAGPLSVLVDAYAVIQACRILSMPPPLPMMPPGPGGPPPGPPTAGPSEAAAAA